MLLYICTGIQDFKSVLMMVRKLQQFHETVKGLNLTSYLINLNFSTRLDLSLLIFGMETAIKSRKNIVLIENVFEVNEIGWRESSNIKFKPKDEARRRQS